MAKITHEEANLNVCQYLADPQAARVFLREYITQQEEFEAKVKRYLELGFPIYEDEAIEYRNFKNELKEMVGLK